MKKINRQEKSWLAKEAEKKITISARLSNDREPSEAAKKKLEMARKHIAIAGLPKEIKATMRKKKDD